jgi:hypothetical protein
MIASFRTIPAGKKSNKSVYDDFLEFIRVEGFNTPPFRALKKVLNPEYKYHLRTTYPVPLGRGC